MSDHTAMPRGTGQFEGKLWNGKKWIEDPDYAAPTPPAPDPPSADHGGSGESELARGSGQFEGKRWDGKKWIDDPDYVAPPTPIDSDVHLVDAGTTAAGAPFESDVQLLHKKAREALQSNLSPGEQVMVVIRGSSAQAIIGTDRRAFVFKKGYMAGASFGHEMSSFMYSHLTGVQIHTGMMSGAVILQGSGLQGSRTNYWRKTDDDPHRSPNAIPLNRPFNTAAAGVVRLRALIDQAHQSGVSTPAAPAPSASVADEIRKLAEMRRDGLITDEEFADLKSHLTSG